MRRTAAELSQLEAKPKRKAKLLELKLKAKARPEKEVAQARPTRKAGPRGSAATRTEWRPTASSRPTEESSEEAVELEEEHPTREATPRRPTATGKEKEATENEKEDDPRDKWARSLVHLIEEKVDDTVRIRTVDLDEGNRDIKWCRRGQGSAGGVPRHQGKLKKRLPDSAMERRGEDP